MFELDVLPDIRRRNLCVEIVQCCAGIHGAAGFGEYCKVYGRIFVESSVQLKTRTVLCAYRCRSQANV